jgi:hypothetical protein
LSGRVSSESFHFNIQLVKSTDMQQAAASPHNPLVVMQKVEPHFDQQSRRDHASVISKSSSSTLT